MNLATSPSQPSDPNKPQVVFPSAYRLSAADEKDLIDYAFDRLDELESELGRDKTRGGSWWEGQSQDSVDQSRKSWMGKRQVYELTYENEMDWRKTAFGEIFEESNWHLPVTRRVVSQQVARANAHFFGSDPWFFADVMLSADDGLQQNAERYLRNKFDEAAIRHTLEAAVERAFVRGEAVVKRGHRRETDIFEAEMEVMVDPATKKPVLDSRGEYVTRDTRVTVVNEAPIIPAAGITKLYSEETAPAQAMKQRMALEDGTVLPVGFAYEKRTVPRRNVLFDGPSLELCYFADLLIPLTAKSIDAADCLVHLYNIPWSDLADQWNREAAGVGEEAQNFDTAAAVEALRAIEGNTGNDTAANSASSLHRAERPEDSFSDNGEVSSKPHTATGKIAEFWLRYDANKDGIHENIILVADRETRRPIRYDYVANVTPDGKRPFSCIRVNPVDGRWYGVGSMQVYEQIQDIIDLQVNRWNVSSGRAGRADFLNRAAIEGGETDPDVPINAWGETLWLKEGFTADQALSFVVLPEVKADDLKNMIDLYMQMAMNMSGVQHANDAGQAGLASAKTATSILNLDKSGHEMFGQILSHLESGIIPAVNAVGEIVIVNMSAIESLHWEDDDRARYSTIRRADLGDHRIRLRLTLSKYKAEQEKLDISSVIAAGLEFYSIQDPTARAGMVALYRQFARHHGVRNPETVFPDQGPPQALPGDGANTVAAPVSPMPHGDETRQPDPAQNVSQMQSGISGGLANVEQQARVAV